MSNKDFQVCNRNSYVDPSHFSAVPSFALTNDCYKSKSRGTAAPINLYWPFTSELLIFGSPITFLKEIFQKKDSGNCLTDFYACRKLLKCKSLGITFSALFNGKTSNVALVAEDLEEKSFVQSAFLAPVRKNRPRWRCITTFKTHIESPQVVISGHKLPLVATSFQKLPQVAKNCLKLPQFTTCCHKLQHVATSWQKLPQIGTSYHKVPQVATNCLKLPQLGSTWLQFA